MTDNLLLTRILLLREALKAILDMTRPDQTEHQIAREALENDAA